MDNDDHTPGREVPIRVLLARAVQRARGSLLWERLWPALATFCHGARPVPRLLLGRAVAGAAAARARHRALASLPDHRRRGGAADPAAAAQHPRRPAPARPRERRAASPGHHRPRSHRRQRSRSGGAGALAGPCRARADVGAQAQGRLAVAAAGAARSDGAARAGADSGGRQLLRRQRRTFQTRRRRLRLARRDGAGEFPHRCLGHAAGLYRPSAGDAVGLAAGPGGAAAERAGSGAGRQRSSWCARPAMCSFDIVRKGGIEAAKADVKQGQCDIAAAQGQRGAPLHHQGRRRRHAARRRQRSDLGLHRHSRPRADHRLAQGSASGRCAARCASTTR